MCCFSRPVQSVSNTNIFARQAKDGRQFLVYSMRFQAKEDLAMILPIPTPENSPENTVKFINFEKYPKFFDDLNRAFPVPLSPVPATRGGRNQPPTKSMLEVVSVGSFEASFVPTITDFDRLDERFRLPKSTWGQLPGYAKFGFAVFKLKKDHHKVHPMAFDFPRANPEKLFFPTVHIHDGSVPTEARFHHSLYCQRGAHGGTETLHTWTESPGVARGVVTQADIVKDYLDLDGHLYRRQLNGEYKNEDVLV